MTPTRAPERSDGIAGALNSEWHRLMESPSATATVSAWGTRKPALSACMTLGDIQVRTEAARDADDVLRSLLELVSEGEALAARVLLQLMLPKALRLARGQHRAASREDADADAIAALWETIDHYAARDRVDKVAASLAMGTLNNFCSSAKARQLTSSDVALPEIALERADPVQGGGRPAVDGEVYELLAELVRDGQLTREEARLLADVHCPANGGSADRRQVAAAWGISEPALRQRCHRLVARAAAAVIADAA